MSNHLEALRNLGLTAGDLRDPFLRRFQRIFDPLAFDREWPLIRAGFDFRVAKTEHIGTHVGKALLKVLSLEKQAPDSAHLVRAEALPDTLMYRTQLANTLRFDLQKQLGGSGTDSSAVEEALELLVVARASIDRFNERIDHDVYVPNYLRHVREVAIPALHFSGLIMANALDEDPREAHANRLIHHLRMTTTVIN